jgi:hypothetical protein
MAVVVGTALIAVPAQAKKPNHGKSETHKTHAKKAPESKGRCGVKKVGWNVSGDNATFAVTKNADGTYDGTVTLTAHKANGHAENSGVNADDTTAETFNLDNTKINFGEDVTDGPDEGTDVGPADVVATDTVKLNGKVQRAKKGSKKKPCAAREGFNDKRYGAYTVRKATVNREPAPAPAPAAPTA